MDFSKLDTKADAEAGAWLHYLHPQLRHPLYSGPGSDDYGRLVDSSKEHTAVEGLIRGTESDHVRAAASRAGAKGVKGEETNEFDFAASLVVQLRGVIRDGKPVTAERDGILWFFGRSEDFALQTINFARERSNFFGAALRNSTFKQGS